MSKAFVLLSGGVDSTTCLHLAYSEFGGKVEGVSMDYGQRHSKEIEYARKSCDRMGIPHKVISLASIVPKTMLTDEFAPLPKKSYAEIEGVSPTYVPYRNGLMLSALCSYVAGEHNRMVIEYQREVPGAPPLAEWGVYFGAHAEDAQNFAYPDCTAEFTGAMANAIYVGTYHAIRLHVPLQWMNKSQIIKRGEELGVNWADTWSCYAGGDKHCGVCPTCRARRDGFIKAGVKDPTDYAASPGAAAADSQVA